MHIGAIVYPDVDQLDLTGPFEVLARLPGATVSVLWKAIEPVRDFHGLTVLPDATFAAAPVLDVLVVPGGPGQEALMNDEQVIGFIAGRAATARYVLSVCTGALLLGAAGLLRGKRASAHWASFDLLEHFGAIPVDERVVVDGNLITTAGVTSGIDGALRLVALLQGRPVAEHIALEIEYAPEPPFGIGRPHAVHPDVVASVRQRMAPLLAARLATARRFSGCP